MQTTTQTTPYRENRFGRRFYWRAIACGFDGRSFLAQWGSGEPGGPVCWRDYGIPYADERRALNAAKNHAQHAAAKA